MTPFVEAARQLVKDLRWRESLSAFTHEHRDLVWRHHGLGMLQAELSEELRIHIWHPRLVSPGMVWPRCVHDHRFDITSAVVIGEIIDVPCEVFEGERAQMRDGRLWHPARQPGWEPIRVYEIEHAKEQDRIVHRDACSTATSARLLASGHVHCGGLERQGPKEEYVIGRRLFHTTRIESLAITVVHRSNFDSRLARILCAPDSDVTAVSGIVRDDSLEHRVLVNRVLREAADAIVMMP